MGDIATFAPKGSSILNFANAGKKTFSVFAVKSDTPGFDVSAEEWYGSGKVPPFLDKSSYISDFLVRVLVLDGDFSDYQALSIDPIYGAYFDTKGLKSVYTDSFGNDTNGLDALIQLPEVNTLAEYIGSLIPEFQDKDGTNLFIEDIINNETSRTGLVCAMNNDWFYDNPSAISDAIVDGLQIDLIGHGIESGTNSTLDFLSYYGAINSLQPFRELDKNSGTSPGTAAGEENQAILDGDTFFTLDATVDYAAWAAGAPNPGQAYDKIEVYGPLHPLVIAGTKSSLYTAAEQAEFVTWASSIAAGESFVSVGVTGADIASVTPALTPVNVTTFAKVKESLLGNFGGNGDDLLTIIIETATEDGTIVPDFATGAGAGAALTLGYKIGDYTGTQASTNNKIEIISKLDYSTIPQQNPTAVDYSVFYGGPASQISADVVSGVITTGDKIQTGPSPTPALSPVQTASIVTNDLTGFSGVIFSIPLVDVIDATNRLKLSHNVVNAQVTAFTDDTYTTEKAIAVGGANTPFASSQIIAIPSNGSATTTIANSLYISTLAGDINEVITIGASNVVAANEVHLTGQQDVQVGQFLVRGFESIAGSGDYDLGLDPRTGKSRLTRITKASYDSATDTFIIKTQDAIWYYYVANLPTAIERYKDLDEFVSNYTATSLVGYSIPSSAKPDGSNTRMNEILDVMYDTNIGSTLQDREAITFRYIVDTFNNGMNLHLSLDSLKLLKEE
jgi:hypothetical protein